jgi:hypothetical protein
MGGKIAFIDTENGSASLYADEFDFDVQEIDAPYTIKKFIDAIDTALKDDYRILIIDSISHAWAGEGGLLAQKEELDARGAAGDRKNKNQYANWASITKEHEKFKAWLLKADCHMICTMRSKQDYALGEDGKVKKLGMAPIQREGMEYEFTTVLDIAMNHTAAASKDRTKLFDNQFFTPSEQTGEALMKWLNKGKGELPHSKTASAMEAAHREVSSLPEGVMWDGQHAYKLKLPPEKWGEVKIPWPKSKLYGQSLSHIEASKLIEVLDWAEEQFKDKKMSPELAEITTYVQEYCVAHGIIEERHRVLPL